MGMFQEAMDVRIPRNSPRIAQNSWHKTCHGVHNDHGWNLAPSQYVVAYGDLIGDQELPHSLVDALVTPANEHDTRML